MILFCTTTTLTTIWISSNNKYVYLFLKVLYYLIKSKLIQKSKENFFTFVRGGPNPIVSAKMLGVPPVVRLFRDHQPPRSILSSNQGCIEAVTKKGY